jgi:hypothetical protein
MLRARTQTHTGSQKMHVKAHWIVLLAADALRVGVGHLNTHCKRPGILGCQQALPVHALIGKVHLSGSKQANTGSSSPASPTPDNATPAQAAASASSGVQSRPIDSSTDASDSAASTLKSAAAETKASAAKTASAAAQGASAAAEKVAAARSTTRGQVQQSGRSDAGTKPGAEGAGKWISEFQSRTSGGSQNRGGGRDEVVSGAKAELSDAASQAASKAKGAADRAAETAGSAARRVETAAEEAGRSAHEQAQKAKREAHSVANEPERSVANEPGRGPWERFVAWLQAIWRAIVRFFSGKGAGSGSAKAA